MYYRTLSVGKKMYHQAQKSFDFDRWDINKSLTSCSFLTELIAFKSDYVTSFMRDNYGL